MKLFIGFMSYICIYNNEFDAITSIQSVSSMNFYFIISNLLSSQQKEKISLFF